MDTTRSRQARLFAQPRLEVLERRDTPTFTALPPFTTQSVDPTVLATGDFNGDGRADVAIANDGGGPGGVSFVGIGLGNGDGSFTAGQQLTSPNFFNLRSVITGDFNRDGKLDLAIGSFIFGSGPPTGILVALGKGDGTFTGPTLEFTGATIALGTADFNGDQIPDLVGIEDIIGPTAVILLGNGDGTFTNPPGPTIDLGTLAADRIATGDFDGDGKQDFATLDDDDGTDSLLVTYGNGNGTFGTPVVTDIADTPTDLVAGDFDADGKLDIVLSADDTIYFHRNLGGRVFNTPGTAVLPPGAFVLRVGSADFNGDGVPDVVAITTGVQALVAISNGNGTFTADPGSPYTPNQPPGADTSFAWGDVATGDFDGDANPDFVTLGQNSSLVGGAGGDVLLNIAPDNTQTILTAAPNPSVAGQTVTLTATVTPLVPPFPPGGQPTGTVTFFVDGVNVGQAPVVNGVASLPIGTLTQGSHAILASYSGDPRFRPSSSATLTQVVQPAPITFQFTTSGVLTGTGGGSDRVANGSFTPDGVVDIVLGSGPGVPARVQILDGKTNQVLADFLPYGPAFTGGVFVAAGDVNGDGVADLAVTAASGGGPRVLVFLTNNGQLVPAADFIALDPGFRGGLRVALGDVNRDGLADLVVTPGEGGGPRVSTYDGRTLRDGVTPTRLWNDFFAFEPNSRLGAFIAVGDLNGDGFGDMVVGADRGGGPRVAILDGASLVSSGQPVVIGNFFVGSIDDRGGVRVAARDLTGEGTPEVLIGSGVGAVPRVWIFSGASLLGSTDPTPLMVLDAFPGVTDGINGGVYVA